jgi:hypothetical protein
MGLPFPRLLPTPLEQYEYAEKVAKVNTGYDKLIQTEPISGSLQFGVVTT